MVLLKMPINNFDHNHVMTVLTIDFYILHQKVEKYYDKTKYNIERRRVVVKATRRQKNV